MHSIGSVLLCFATVAILAQGVHPLPPASVLPNQQGLARLFFASRITQQDPMQSMACFADYIAESNSISEKYGSAYNECLVSASGARKQIDIEAFKDRQAIETSAEAVCTRMRSCNSHNSTLDMFNCHANVGPNNTKSTYSISGNAAEHATMLQERYRLVELHHEQCCHTAEKAYVESTAQNYNHLQACLDGRAEPRPPKTTSTSAPTTSTAAPTPTTSTTTTTTTTTTEDPTTAPAMSETIMPPQGIPEQFAQLLNLLN